MSRYVRSAAAPAASYAAEEQNLSSRVWEVRDDIDLRGHYQVCRSMSVNYSALKGAARFTG